MTGFGIATVETPSIKVTVELKSLNSKFLELNLKLPKALSEQESFVRNECSRLIERGKANLSFTLERNSGSGDQAVIDTDLAKHYYQQLQQLAIDLKADAKDIFRQVFQFPDVLKMDGETITEDDWKQAQKAFEQAFAAFDEFRKQEGRMLDQELRLRVQNIQRLQEQVAVLEPKRLPYVREKLNQLFAMAEGVAVDSQRLEQELILYADRYDMTEEQVRLKAHCGYFLETLALPQSNGKKLGFISQEMGREINTMGSKSYDAGIQKLVVEMKDELEKIKEQLNNVL